MRTETVKPAREGLKVRDPERGNHLPEAGASVPLTSYWLRRLRDRDVVPVTLPTQPAATSKKRDEE